MEQLSPEEIKIGNDKLKDFKAKFSIGDTVIDVVMKEDFQLANLMRRHGNFDIVSIILIAIEKNLLNPSINIPFWKTVVYRLFQS